MKNILTLILCSTLAFQPMALYGMGPNGQPTATDGPGKGKGFPDQPTNALNSQSMASPPAASQPEQAMPPSHTPAPRSATAAPPSSPGQARKAIPPQPATPAPKRKRMPLNLDGTVRQSSMPAGRASNPPKAPVPLIPSQESLSSFHSSPSLGGLLLPPLLPTGSRASQLAAGVSAVGSLPLSFAPIPLNPSPAATMAEQEDDEEQTDAQASSTGQPPLNTEQLLTVLSGLALALQNAPQEQQNALRTVLSGIRPSSGQNTPVQQPSHNGSRRGSAIATPTLPSVLHTTSSEPKAAVKQTHRRSNSAEARISPAVRTSNSPHPIKASASAIQLESPSATPTVKSQKSVGFSDEPPQSQPIAAPEEEDAVAEEKPPETPMRERKDTRAVVDDTYQAAEQLAGAFAPGLGRVLKNPKVKEAVMNAAAHNGRVRGIVRAFAEAQYLYHIIVGVLTAFYAVWSFFYQAQQGGPGQPPPPGGGLPPPQ